MFCSRAWSAMVCCSWASVSRLDWFILSNLSSKWWILEDCKSSSADDEEGAATEPARLYLAFLASLVYTAGPEGGGSAASTTGSSTKNVLGAMTFVLRTSASTSAIGDVSCALLSGNSSSREGVSSSSSLTLAALSALASYEAPTPARSSSSCSSSSSDSSSEGATAFPFLPEALGAVLGCYRSST